MLEQPDWKCVIDAKAGLGEEPHWFADEQALYWTDGFRPALYRTTLQPRVDTREWLMPEEIGSFALCRSRDKALVALETGVFVLDFESGATTRHVDAPFDTAEMQFNDGRCDPAGRFWVGPRYHPDSKLPFGRGWIYRLDDRGFVPVIDEVTGTNGIAWSPDARTMYMSDRRKGQITAFDFDLQSGTPSNRWRFSAVPQSGYNPDGASVDSEGGYWTTYPLEGLIVRYTPDGRVHRQLKAPTLVPTMVAFGGPDLATLFVTTAAGREPDAPLPREPLAGGLFSCNVGARGLPEHRYAFL
jgi:sugar lactone lactonase YvrE